MEKKNGPYKVYFLLFKNIDHLLRQQTQEGYQA